MNKRVKEIKAVFFDSSVLLNLQKEKMQDELRNIVSYYLPVERFMSAYATSFNKFQLGLLDEKSFFKSILRDFKIPLETQNKIIKQHDIERAKLVKLDFNVKSVITNLNSSGYLLGLISSMPKEWFLSDAKRLGLDVNNFKTMIFSKDTKCLKNDKKIFDIACKTIKVKPEFCAYVTNHERELITAGLAGMTVIGLGINSDFSVDSLNELIDFLNNEDSRPKKRHETPTP